MHLRSPPPSPRAPIGGTGRRGDERGIALLLVLIALLLLAVLSIEVAQTSATQARIGGNSMNEFLLRTAVDGRVNILKSALAYDLSLGANVDSEDEVWSWHENSETLSSWGERDSFASERDDPDELAAETVDASNLDAEVTAWCEDERSKINLIGLSRPEGTPERRHTRDALIRLIDGFREEWSELDLNESEAEDMVDRLLDWLGEQGEEEENPTPDVIAGRGRLLAVDDLLRVGGDGWNEQVLFDVRDPNLDPDEEVDEDDSVGGAGNDSDWRRPNGVPGLVNFVTVYAEPVANPPLRVNVNTAPVEVLRALLEPVHEDLAETIVEHRREGADSDDDGGAAGNAGTGGEGEEQSGWFENKGQLTRVDGMGESLDAYPRLNFFADVQSNVFSLRVIARMPGANPAAASEDFDEDDAPAVPDSAVFQYREVVQRLDNGFRTLWVERRFDPRLSQ